MRFEVTCTAVYEVEAASREEARLKAIGGQGRCLRETEVARPAPASSKDADRAADRPANGWFAGW